MCMSLIIKTDENTNEQIVYAFVGVNDNACYIYEYKLHDILEKCHPINNQIN
jgi:hypothetical protein